jgi:hypothetical protein
VRPGKKYHESLISKDETQHVYESDDDYIILQPQTMSYGFEDVKGLKKAGLVDLYSSDKVTLLKKDELKEILIKEKIVEK